MRFQLISITKIVPALLVLVMAASAPAQSNFQNGYAANAVRKTSNTSTSRYRFIPTQKQPSKPAFGGQLGNGLRVASSTPAKDLSTLPSRFNPEVDSAAFHAPTPFETPSAADRLDTSYHAIDRTGGMPNPAVSRVYAGENTPQPEVYPPSHTYKNAAELSYQTPNMPMNRNFFGIDKNCICDEWNGFVACGGLKANPGHCGQPFFVGCDPCEPPCGRCSKGLIEKHRSKHGKSGVCTGCRARRNSSTTGCDECATCGHNACAIQARFENQQPDCECAASPNGLFGRLK